MNKFFILSLLIVSLQFVKQVNAGDCVASNQCDQVNGFSCWTNGWCCKCTCGNDGTNTLSGPFECENIGACTTNPCGDRQGCLPCPTPTSPPPEPCCRNGDVGYCETRYTTYNTCVADFGCYWDTSRPNECPIPPSPTPVQISFMCIRPGSTIPGDRCATYYQACPNPNIIGALCYSNIEICQRNCLLDPPVIITTIPELNILTPCAKKGYVNSLDTAIGCFPTGDTQEMLIFILRWALGVGGGITFLLIVYSGFLIMASGANAEKVKAGKELMTAAITGLLLIIFSVFILDFLGLRILRVPGL